MHSGLRSEKLRDTSCNAHGTSSRLHRRPVMAPATKRWERVQTRSHASRGKEKKKLEAVVGRLWSRHGSLLFQPEVQLWSQPG